MTASPRSRVRKAGAFAARVAVELAIVFVGVYAAFALAQRQAEADHGHRRRVLTEALGRELAVFGERVRASEQEFEGIEAYVAAIDSGARPPLQPLNSFMPISVDVWRAAVASGGLELLEPGVVVGLAQFYGRVEAVRDLQADTEANARAVLLPNLGRPPEEFYDADGRLRPKYAWYRQSLSRLVDQVRVIGAGADSLRGVLVSPEPAEGPAG